MRKLALALLTAAALALPVLPAHGSTGAGQSTSGPNAAPQRVKTTSLTAAILAEPIITSCSGYQTLASISSSGHRLSTKGQICGAYWGSDGDRYIWGPVARFKCYRNGVQFGNATGGCRWAGSLSNYEQKSSPHRYTSFYRRPGSISAAYWDDSGRIYGAYSSYYGGYAQNHCQDSWGGYYYNIVHYHGTTGTDIGIYNMIDTCTPWFYATATP